MKKYLKLTVSFIMAVVMAVIPFTQTVAAASASTYIRDIRMANAESFESAKKTLNDAGFTVVDRDLNATTTENFVIIGCQETDDPAGAITDIKALKEENGYTIFNAEEVMAELEGEALEDAIYLKRIIDVFRDNYNAGQKLAVQVYDFFQSYQYSDTQLLGDFLINPALTANELTDIILNSAPEMATGLYQFLCASLIPDSGDTCFSRYAAVDPDDYELDDTLKSKARALLTSVKSYALYVEREVNAALESKEELGDAAVINTDILVSSYFLSECKNGENNLLSLMISEDLVIDDLYPLASCMTDAEIQAMKFLGMAQFVNIMSWGESDLVMKASATDIDIDSEETHDFWEGSIKRQNGRIAITNDVMQQMIIGNTESLSNMLMSVENSLAYSASILCSVATTITATVYYLRVGALATTFSSRIVASATQGIVEAMARYCQAIEWETGTGFYFFESISTFKAAAMPNAQIVGCEMKGAYSFVQRMSPSARLALTSSTKFAMQTSSTATNAAKGVLYKAGNVMKATIVLTAVVVLISVIFMVIDLVAYYNPEYSEFPTTVLSQETLEDGSTGYVYYQAVMDGDRVGDTNAREGRKWNALYYTTSPAMGAPIRAGSIVGYSDPNDAPSDLFPVSLFGVSTAYNLNTNTYDHESGVYLFFDRVNPDTLASIFSYPNLLFIGGAALMLAGITIYIVAVIKKKKKSATV